MTWHSHQNKATFYCLHVNQPHPESWMSGYILHEFGHYQETAATQEWLKNQASRKFAFFKRSMITVVLIHVCPGPRFWEPRQQANSSRGVGGNCRQNFQGRGQDIINSEIMRPHAHRFGSVPWRDVEGSGPNCQWCEGKNDMLLCGANYAVKETPPFP